MHIQRARPRSLPAACLTCLLAIVLTLVACGGTNGPTAQQLIKNAQVAIQKVKSYHFNLAVDNPGTGGRLTIKTANGDILVPDKLRANANALVFGNAVKVQIIAIGDEQYVTDPITGNWIAVSGLLDPRTLSDSTTGVAAILGHIQDPSAPTDANVDGAPCWSIDGTLDARYLAGIAGGNAQAGSRVATTTCIGKSDNLPYLIRLSGIAVQGDTTQTVRTFKLSKFGENLTITAPI